MGTDISWVRSTRESDIQMMKGIKEYRDLNYIEKYSSYITNWGAYWYPPGKITYKDIYFKIDGKIYEKKNVEWGV